MLKGMSVLNRTCSELSEGGSRRALKEAVEAAVARVCVRQHQYPLSTHILTRLSNLPSVTQAKPLRFPGADDLLVTHKDERIEVLAPESASDFRVVVDKAHREMYVLFYRDGWSNFAANEARAVFVGDHEIEYACPESTFKAICYAMHVETGRCQEEQLANVFTATRPADVKNSTRRIPNFYPALWDARSQDAMRWAVAFRLKSPTAFYQMKLQERLAEEYGISLADVHHVEATRNDRIWASGVDVEPLVAEMIGYRGDRLYKDVVTKSGANQLGECLDDALLAASTTGTVEEYSQWFDRWVQPILTQAPVIQ